MACCSPDSPLPSTFSLGIANRKANSFRKVAKASDVTRVLYSTKKGVISADSTAAVSFVFRVAVDCFEVSLLPWLRSVFLNSSTSRLLDSSSSQTVLSRESQMDSSGHSAHRGLRAWQTFLPNQITWWPKDIQRSRGTSLIRSCSTFSGVF